MSGSVRHGSSNEISAIRIHTDDRTRRLMVIRVRIQARPFARLRIECMPGRLRGSAPRRDQLKREAALITMLEALVIDRVAPGTRFEIKRRTALVAELGTLRIFVSAKSAAG